MQGRIAAAFLFAAGLCLLTGGSAGADDAAVLVNDSGKVTLTAADDGEATADVTLQNQGPEALPVAVTAATGAATGCDIEASPATVPAHRQQKVTLTFDADCQPRRTTGTNFTVTAGGLAFDLHADPPKDPDPDWGDVALAYGYALFGSAVVLLIAWFGWRAPTTPGPRTKDLRMSLPGLEASWKFTDSWAANATVLTALFTGLFGTDKVTNALIGEDASTNLLAVALVSAAVSVGLAGLAPMVLQMLRRRFDEVPPVLASDGAALTGKTAADLYVTPLGLLGAGLLTLTATAGQLGSILLALGKTDFATDSALVLVGILAGLVLIGYGLLATWQNLTIGATLSPPEEAKAADDAVRSAVREAVEAAAEAPGRTYAEGVAPAPPVIVVAAAPSVSPAPVVRRPAAIL